ncbi:MAG: transcriptional regulator [Candidatus Saccharibacteria bacterium]
MDTVTQVFNAMKSAGKPVGASDIVKATGLDKKDVDKAMTQLKKEDKIVSPVKCKWEPK